MFNNKGGVGKTTLTCNLAAYIAKVHSLRVLVIDCDPQCNSTQLMLGMDTAAGLYIAEERDYSTIKDVLRPLAQGDSSINTNISIVRANQNRFGVDLLPGDPGLAIIEDALSAAWAGVKGRTTEGFRRTNWNVFLCRHFENDYDLIFFDLGPSLGSINRSVLMGCDHFMTPLSSDIFSIIGVRNISVWLKEWIDDYEQSWLSSKLEDRNELLDVFRCDSQPRIKEGYVGYTIQQYITKSYGGVRRATSAYEAIISQVDTEISGALSSFYSKSMANDSVKLGDIPHLFSLVPLAQRQAVPILDLKASDGLVGAQYAQVKEFERNLAPIALNLLRNTGLSS
jgi:cellulose biosynthesis protein BcsQ